MFQLTDWFIERIGEGLYVVWGYLSGNKRFQDGTYVHTSQIVSIEQTPDSQCLMTGTVSGSTYCMKKQDIYSEKLSMTDKYLTELGLPEFCGDAVRCMEQAKAEEMHEADELLSVDELLLLMVGTACQGAYFKGGDGIHELRVEIHADMFQDSIICSQTGVADFRYYPMEGDEPVMDSYHASSNIRRILVKNLGKADILFQQGVVCRAGSVTAVEKEYFQGEGLLSPDNYNGESLLSQLAEWKG